ncbi:MAG: N-acetylneuraminate synthase family protein, partial [Dehalococcoidia bacterium]
MEQTIQVGNRLVGEGQSCFIVAEAGVNHNGDVALARKLIDVAVEAGADAVKFQKRSIEEIFIQSYLENPYFSVNGLGATYGEHRRRLELTEDEFAYLIEYAREKGIIFYASAWDARSADFLDSLQVPAFKITSADVTNLPLIEHIAKKRKPIFMSTGMSTMDEVDEAVATIMRYHDQLILQHCVSTYPCESKDVNLQVMNTLRTRFGVPVGYSGHERGIAIPAAAAALGAVVVEKHFTLDRTMKGPDHAASLEAQGLQR